MVENLLLILAGIAFIAWGILGNSFNWGDVFGVAFVKIPAPRWLGKAVQILFGTACLVFGVHHLLRH